MAEKNYTYNPFIYTGNNPIRFIDPDGRDWYEDECSGEFLWFKGSDEIKGFINRGADYQNGRNLYTTDNNGDPLQFNNAMDPVEITGKREYKYPDGFVGNVNKVVNNLFGNTPSKEAHLREDKPLNALKIGAGGYLQAINIASTFTAVGGGVGLTVKGFQAKKGLDIFNAFDVSVNTAGLLTQGIGVENKQLNMTQSILGIFSLQNLKKGEFGVGNFSDLFDVFNTPPIEVNQEPKKK